MNEDIFYEPVGEENHRRIITSLENEISRLKAQLLPGALVSPRERDNQKSIWLELDRVTRYLAEIREKAFDFVRRA
jgi:hypothetical protein